MILYHFTQSVNLPSILRDGLVQSTNPKALPPYDCIWLTTDPDRRMLEDGSMPDEAERIKVVIPTSDRKLKKWTTWIRKYDAIEHGDGKMLDVGGMLKALEELGITEHHSDWVYFAPIPPSRFHSITHIPVREACNAR